MKFENNGYFFYHTSYVCVYVLEYNDNVPGLSFCDGEKPSSLK